MDLPKNLFKAALKAGRHQLGIWNSLGGPSSAEVLAGAGFDWVLIDTEHAPLEVTDVLPALLAVAGYPGVSAIVRPAINDWVLIKRILDLGAQTLLIPYVQSADEARAAVAAMRYPPGGLRGMGGTVRASRFGRVSDYPKRAEEELCLLVQVETATALADMESIAGVEGVDGIFFGPADLSASMGFPGQPLHPEVTGAILDAIARLKKLGMPAGILSLNEDFTARCIDAGTGFTAAGVDLALLVSGAEALRRRFS